jgi:hypothetical protein
MGLFVWVLGVPVPLKLQSSSTSGYFVRILELKSIFLSRWREKRHLRMTLLLSILRHLMNSNLRTLGDSTWRVNTNLILEWLLASEPGPFFDGIEQVADEQKG